MSYYFLQIFSMFFLRIRARANETPQAKSADESYF